MHAVRLLLPIAVFFLGHFRPGQCALSEKATNPKINGRMPTTANVRRARPSGGPSSEEAIIINGLNPKHPVPSSKDDQALFEHSFVHREPATGTITYLQYKAKRRPDLVMLDQEPSVLEYSSALPVSGNENFTALTIQTTDIESGQELRLETKVVVFRDPDGKHQSYRVLNCTRRVEVRKGLVFCLARLASSHEVFEHSAVEYFRGRPHALRAGRRERAASFETAGVQQPMDGFANTEDILQAAVTRRQLHEIELASKDGVSPLAHMMLAEPDVDEVGTAGRDGRSLSSYVSDDARVEWAIGTECGRRGTQTARHTNSNDCYFTTGDSADEKYTLVSGNTYTVRFTPSDGGGRYWQLNLYEVKSATNGLCKTWNLNKKAKIGEQDTVTFTIPDKNLLEKNCGDLTDFPEYVLELGANCGYDFLGIYHYCSYDAMVLNGNQFRIAEQPDSMSTRFDRKKDFDFEEVLSNALKLEVKCTDCGVSADAEVHIYTSTSNYVPIDEVWAYGDFDITGGINLVALATANQQKEWRETLFPRVCLYPVCFGVNLAGILDIKVGAMISVEVAAEARFNGKAEFRYSRETNSQGTVYGHIRLPIGGTAFTDLKQTGFEFGDVATSAGSSTPSPSRFEVEMEGSLSLKITPFFEIGLFSSLSAGGLNIEADASVGIRADLTLASLGFGFRSPVPFSPRCSSSGCGFTTNGLCGSEHDTFIEAKLGVVVEAELQCNFNGDLADWYEFVNYQYQSDFRPFYEDELLVGTWCYNIFSRTPGAACPSSCPATWPGDGECDAYCNFLECAFDGGDCGTSSPTSSLCSPGCYLAWPGDGYCDAACDIAECNFDDGDCEAVSRCYVLDDTDFQGNDLTSYELVESAEVCCSLCYSVDECKVWTWNTLSNKCWLKSEAALQGFEEQSNAVAGLKISLCPSSCSATWLSDGYCDPYCNILECAFDGGDCEGEPTSSPTVSLCSPGCYPTWPGDGYCDSTCNNAACNFDEGDCDGDNYYMYDEDYRCAENCTTDPQPGYECSWLKSMVVAGGCASTCPEDIIDPALSYYNCTFTFASVKSGASSTSADADEDQRPEDNSMNTGMLVGVVVGVLAVVGGLGAAAVLLYRKKKKNSPLQADTTNQIAVVGKEQELVVPTPNPLTEQPQNTK